MKDPLQKQPTPYEILSVSPDATAKEIDDAFKKGLGKSKNVKQKQDARQFLLNRPLDRALLNLFLYDDAVLEKLDPNPLHDPDALDVSRRAETARKWRKQFRHNAFPDPGIARALGILWYWSACQTSERFAETGEQGDEGGIPAWQDSWESAMGYWAFVITTPDFWAENRPPPSLSQDDIRAGVQQRIASDLHRFTQLQRDAGHAEAADRFQQLEMDLARELETAKTLLDAEAKINKKFLCLGNMMLVRMGLVEQIVAYIDERLGNPSPKDTKKFLDLLHKLKEDLSSYGKIATLVRNGRFEAAINQIESLSPNERELPEVLGFEAQARFQFGQQLASVNKLDEALACWERALQCAQSDNLRREIAEAAETACINVSTQNPPRDEAIHVFESGLRIAPHSEKLRLRLADLLTQRGIDAVNEAKKKAEKEGQPSEETLGMAKRGIADLRRAAKELGSERAAEQYKAAREVEEEISLPRHIRKLWEEANQVAGRQDWGQAIEKLRKALRELSLKQPNLRALNQLRKNLSVCLNNYSTDRFSVALSELLQMLAATINTALTPNGLESLRVALAPRWKLLYSACTTLCEAIQLDPSNDHALQNLRGIEQQISQLESSNAGFLKPSDIQKPSISAGTLNLLQEAYAALENEDWDQAADKFAKAISQLGSQASEHLPREFPISAEAQQLLDEAYAARERGNWNEAIEKFRKANNLLGSRMPEQAKEDFADLLAQRGVNRQNEVMQTPGLTGKDRASKLHPARDDLREAEQLDPSDDNIARRLEYIEKIISALEINSPLPPPPQPVDKKLIERIMGRFTIKNWALIAFHLFIFILTFKVASYDHGSLFFYETYLPPDQWLLSLQNNSTFGKLAVSSATLVCLIGAFLLLFANWFSWKNKLSKAAFFILPETIIVGWLAIFSLGLVYMPSIGSDQKGLSGKVVTGSAVMASAKARIPKKTVLETPMEFRQLLANQKLVVDQVTKALMQIDSRASDPTGDQRLRTEINVLQNQLPILSKETRSVTTFLIAAALEKIDLKAATFYYDRLTQGDGQYVATGRIRKSELEATDLDQLEKVYKESLEKPATEGWFRTTGSWERTTTHRTASLGLMDLRKDNISIRLFDWLRSKSFLPLSYAYLFVLTVLAIMLELIKLPFLVAILRIDGILKPEVERIKKKTAKDLIENQLAEFYKRLGVDPALGMVYWFIDIAFAIWILWSLRAWAPQMELDGSIFLWITDIFQPSHSLLFVWFIAGISFLVIAIANDPNGSSAVLIIANSALSFIVPAIAWFFDWPAYMAIAWMLLWGISAGIQLILVLILTKLDLGRASGNFPPKADFVCKTN
ncbi:MAG: hypothetical protein RKO66_15200 [Candidatus Contendobacter sp.]|nr:hypothetical protein [Candidatus Contendobacter sp.]MDS4060686.1 hypothetical protein [Candidatus Contendobacter sp.]